MPCRIVQRAVSNLIVLFLPLMPVTLAAQSFWFERNSAKTLALEFYKPGLAESHWLTSLGEPYTLDYAFKTFALFLSTRFPVGQNKFFVAELPFAYAEVDTKFDHGLRSRSRTGTLGNPYLGLEFGSLTSRFFTELGIRPPLTKEGSGYAANVGRASQYDRPEAFEHLASLRAMINYRSPRTRGVTFRARAGVVVQRDLDRLSDHFFSMPLDTQIGYGYEIGSVRLGLDLYVRIEAGYTHQKFTSFVFNRGSETSFKLSQKQRLGLSGSFKLDRLRLSASFPALFSDSERASSIPDFDLFGLNLSLQL